MCLNVGTIIFIIPENTHKKNNHIFSFSQRDAQLCRFFVFTRLKTVPALTVFFFFFQMSLFDALNTTNLFLFSSAVLGWRHKFQRHGFQSLCKQSETICTATATTGKCEKCVGFLSHFSKFYQKFQKSLKVYFCLCF